jgi:hypothetical protein
MFLQLMFYSVAAMFYVTFKLFSFQTMSLPLPSLTNVSFLSQHTAPQMTSFVRVQLDFLFRKADYGRQGSSDRDWMLPYWPHRQKAPFQFNTGQQL